MNRTRICPLHVNSIDIVILSITYYRVLYSNGSTVIDLAKLRQNLSWQVTDFFDVQELFHLRSMDEV